MSDMTPTKEDLARSGLNDLKKCEDAHLDHTWSDKTHEPFALLAAAAMPAWIRRALTAERTNVRLKHALTSLLNENKRGPALVLLAELRGEKPPFDPVTGESLADKFEPCCECGEDYPRADLVIRSQIYYPKCRAAESLGRSK